MIVALGLLVTITIKITRVILRAKAPALFSLAHIAGTKGRQSCFKERPGDKPPFSFRS
jgi:hypothetical protein